ALPWPGADGLAWTRCWPPTARWPAWAGRRIWNNCAAIRTWRARRRPSSRPPLRCCLSAGREEPLYLDARSPVQFPFPQLADQFQLALDRPRHVAQPGGNLLDAFALHSQQGHLAQVVVQQAHQMAMLVRSERGKGGVGLAAEHLPKQVAVVRAGLDRRPPAAL